MIKTKGKFILKKTNKDAVQQPYMLRINIIMRFLRQLLLPRHASKIQSLRALAKQSGQLSNFYSSKTSNNSGFTLIELIIIIILVGILAIVISPKIEIGSFSEDTDIMQLYSDIRYVQHKSMVDGGGWSIKLDGTNKKYTIYDNNGNVANIPSVDNPVKLKNKFSSNINQLYFDYLGRPDSDTDSTNNNLLNTETTITLGNRKILIVPYSGGIIVH
ncbi:hypothetical protein DEFDS_1246 [Deferribacter desulfuricans SSM1]|uniref:General secretion pathway protein H n=1 Tax=Deferribacter desulfuricans (strain DSM 14783 / JCM 11476 / NBRC 101012 / SSM1) TaxID=639282 RepID=D3PDP1_DEFDS|nr:prepilin-type N-terminal cleavage/methylation domain-containing protein [Deferribacter desulfuricans]BAI80714.1 hypothetical protein DEFDS_1246 [Deferribacter desulfuricans SSM1]